jgi:hypothetical protein
MKSGARVGAERARHVNVTVEIFEVKDFFRNQKQAEIRARNYVTFLPFRGPAQCGGRNRVLDGHVIPLEEIRSARGLFSFKQRECQLNGLKRAIYRNVFTAFGYY